MRSVLKQSFSMAINSLLATKARSFLTMLGIIIGVAAVILIMSIGAGAQSLILNQIKTLGTNLLVVLPGASEKGSPPAQAMGITITTLTYEDYQLIKNPENVPNVSGIVIYSKNAGSVSWKSTSYDTSISGTNASYQDVEGGNLVEGRFFSDEEESNLSKVVVLGYTVKKEVFGESSAIGQVVKIKKQNYTVIGVMEERGTVAFQDYDDQVFIPVKTVQKIMSGVDHLGFMRIKINKEENIDKAMYDIASVLRDNHDIGDNSGASDDFTIQSGNDAMEMIKTITNSLKYFLALMAAMSLIVGGIGIMNIMLVSVTERTREIGLRKAVGAKTYILMIQFLIESITITVIGGILGIIVGVVSSYLVNLVVNYLGYSWDYVITLGSILAGLLVSIGVGLFFGLYPAKKASKLDPISALRHE